MTPLLTGGMGYIGSHMAVALIMRGMMPVIIDNLCNSDITTIDRIKKIIGKRQSVHAGWGMPPALSRMCLKSRHISGGEPQTP